MKLEELDLSELPQTLSFHKLMDEEGIRLEVYNPTTIDKDLPFMDHWWKYAYWLPIIRKEFYLMAISTPDFNKGLMDITSLYGMDLWFFEKHYKPFIKRLEWMRKNNKYNHIGELK